MNSKIDMVFCGSMCDVFEERVDLAEPRRRLFKLILETPNLVWLLLTKRPENILRHSLPLYDPTTKKIADNVCLGLSAGNTKTLHERLPAFQGACDLLNPGVKFLSAEPLIGSLVLPKEFRFDWVIVGGESGVSARPMKPLWANDLLYECLDNDIPFFFKQWGEHNDRGEKVGKKEAGRTILNKEWNETPWKHIRRK